ncbi:hypothetical protein R6Q59_033744 [Mikania micrantha]
MEVMSSNIFEFKFEGHQLKDSLFFNNGLMNPLMAHDASSSSMSPVSSPSSVVFVDLYGKRRQVAKVQVLEREIGLLQDEIKSLVELQPASRCCKELDDYVEATPDPLIAMYEFSFTSFHHNLFLFNIDGHLYQFASNSSRLASIIEDQVDTFLKFCFVYMMENRNQDGGEKLCQWCVAATVVGVLTQKAVAHVFHVQKTAVVVERNHVAWDVVIAPAAAILHAQHVLFVAVASHVFAFKCMIRTLKF